MRPTPYLGQVALPPITSATLPCSATYAGSTNWRIWEPVDALPSRWDEISLHRFLRIDYPTFDSPVGSDILWPSVREYDETATVLQMMD